MNKNASGKMTALIIVLFILVVFGAFIPFLLSAFAIDSSYTFSDVSADSLSLNGSSSVDVGSKFLPSGASTYFSALSIYPSWLLAPLIFILSACLIYLIITSIPGISG